MRGGSIILPHCNDQVLSNEKLSFHLGLSIPKPTNSCRIIIKNDNEYFYKNEENGKIIIFDSTYEHYSYNQSNEDQLILFMDFISL
jgi:aspartyl/asparaginyl beta-hydroxylase (cupin superfamily)